MHLPFFMFDHLPILVEMGGLAMHYRRKAKLYRFEEKRLADPECKEVVQQLWNMEGEYGSPMYRLTKKIKLCRTGLVNWSKIRFGET